jgi:hypothetical protein
MSPLLLAYLACPIILMGIGERLAFLLLAAPFAALGAAAGQGSWMRILGAALGAALRDAVIVALVATEVLVVTNPEYMVDYSLMAGFLAASGAALLTVLTPYRGRVVPVMAAVGAVGGQCAIMWLPDACRPVESLLPFLR